MERRRDISAASLADVVRAVGRLKPSDDSAFAAVVGLLGWTARSEAPAARSGLDAVDVLPTPTPLVPEPSPPQRREPIPSTLIEIAVEEPRRPRVFVSGASLPEAWARAAFGRIEDGLTARLGALGPYLLIAGDELRAGDAWQGAIHEWISSAAAALIVVDDTDALGGWQRREIEILQEAGKPVFVLARSRAEQLVALPPGLFNRQACFLRGDAERDGQPSESDLTNLDHLAEAMADAIQDRLPILLAERPRWLQQDKPVIRLVARPQPFNLPLEPILNPRIERALLGLVAAETRAEGELDVPRLIRSLVTGELLSELPRRAVRTTARGLVLLLDGGERMLAFTRDLNDTARKVRRELGPDRVRVRWFRECPDRGWARRPADEIEAWQPPSRGTPVLAISDLGIGEETTSTELRWIAIAEALAANGSTLTVLVPFPADRFPAGLARACLLVPWDRSTGVRDILRNANTRPQIDRPRRASTDDVASAKERLEALRRRNAAAHELAVRACLAVRIEPQLARELRLRVEPALDISAETDLYNADLFDARAIVGFVLAADVQDLLREELAGTIDKLDCAWKVTWSVHRRGPQALLYEEHLAYLTLRGLDEPRRRRTAQVLLRRLVRSLDGEAGSNLTAWALRAFPRLPNQLMSDAGLAEARRLGLEVARRSGATGVMRGIPAALRSSPTPATEGRARVWIRLVQGGVEASASELTLGHAIDLAEPLQLLASASPREPVVLREHTDGVSSVAWNPDGTRLASGSRDNTIRLYDPAARRETTRFEGHTDGVSSVAWSPDGMRLVSGSRDNTIRLWDLASGDCLRTLQGHTDSVSSVAWSPDGMRFASGSKDKTMRLWDLARGDCLRTLQGHTDSVGSVAWSPDGMRLVSGSRDNTIRLWDLARGDCLRTLQGHTDSVGSVAWSPDGMRLVSGSRDNTIRLWDLASGDCLQTLQGHTDSVSSVAWSPDGMRLASGSKDKTMRLWDVATGRETTRLDGHTDPVAVVAWSPDGVLLASGSMDGTVRVVEWDDRSNAIVAGASAPGFVELLANEIELLAADGRRWRLTRVPIDDANLETESPPSAWLSLRITIDASPGSERTMHFATAGGKARTEATLSTDNFHAAEAMLRRSGRRASTSGSLRGTSRALYELVCPDGIKSLIVEASSLRLILDAGASSYPWELMDDRRPQSSAVGDVDSASRLPLAARCAIVRQLMEGPSLDRRRAAEGRRRALVIGDPRGAGSPLDRLPGAEAEARQVAALLEAGGFAVTALIGERIMPEDVVSALFADDWEIIHIAAHGVFEHRFKDDPTGESRTGIVLGGQPQPFVLDCEMLHQLPVVPELVFVNCCSLGAIDATDERAHLLADRPALASIIAVQLIRMGVRAVIAAGWEVGDEPACRFATSVYGGLLGGGAFYEVTRRARNEVWQAFPTDAAWGAYQCYGDPAMLLEDPLQAAFPA